MEYFIEQLDYMFGLLIYYIWINLKKLCFPIKLLIFHNIVLVNINIFYPRSNIPTAETIHCQLALSHIDSY